MYALCNYVFFFDSVSNLVSPSPIFLGRCGCWRSTYFTVVQRWCSEGLRFEPGRAMRDAREGFLAATRQSSMMLQATVKRAKDERNISKQSVRFLPRQSRHHGLPWYHHQSIFGTCSIYMHEFTRLTFVKRWLSYSVIQFPL